MMRKVAEICIFIVLHSKRHEPVVRVADVKRIMCITVTSNSISFISFSAPPEAVIMIGK